MKWIKLSERKPEKEDAYFAPSPEGLTNVVGLVLVRYRNWFVKTVPYDEVEREYNAEYWKHFTPPSAPDPFDEWYDSNIDYMSDRRSACRMAWDAAKSMD